MGKQKIEKSFFADDFSVPSNVLKFKNIFQSIAQVASKHSYLFRLPLNLLIRQTKILPFEKQTAQQFMFGYETMLTTLGNTFLPNWITFDKVGLIDRVSSKGVSQWILDNIVSDRYEILRKINDIVPKMPKFIF